ncbi:MAG: sugar ABC transporter permease [Christensenellaceae bacterium]|nr:sugar ABC transporter permease [Christensenellaceae bacterium]
MKNKNSFIKNYLHKNPQTKYVAPAMLVLIILTIIPSIFLYIISMTNYQLGWDFSRAKFVGFENFIRLFSGRDPDFWHSVKISLIFTFLSTSIQLILGYLIALLLNFKEFKLKGLVIGIMIIPLAITPTIAGQMWKLMFNSEYGLINYFLNLFFGIKITWLSADMAFWSILIVDIWQFTPFITLMLYSGLRTVPREPYESAKIDGANSIQSFFYITVPMMKNLTILALLLRMADALKLFDTAFVLTQGGPGRATEFLSLHVYRMVNAQNGLIGRGAAVAIVLLLLVTTISNALLKLQRREN